MKFGDEAVFIDPDKFDVGRSPNEHVSFGYGEYFCLGANLARLEMRTLFKELLPYLGQIEMAGPISRTRSVVVPGIKHLTIRFSVARRVAGPAATYLEACASS